MYYVIDIQNSVYYPKFRHIQAYSRPIQPIVAYLEPYHIQNPGIFRTQDIFGTLSRIILAYSERCVMLAY